jgi:hypothetical protein
MTLVFLAVLGLQVVRGDREARLPLGYLVLTGISFVILSSMIRFTAFGSRYQLPFFALVAPSFGYVVGRWRPTWIPAALGVALIVTARPWFLHLRTPVTGDPRVSDSRAEREPVFHDRPVARAVPDRHGRDRG